MGVAQSENGHPVGGDDPVGRRVEILSAQHIVGVPDGVDGGLKNLIHNGVRGISLGNFLVDILSAVIDPRIKYNQETGGKS